MRDQRYGTIKPLQPGFTLIEVLVAIALTAVIMTVVHSLYTFQHRTFRVQEQVGDAQQNARAALQMIARDAVMAGYSSGGITFANHTSFKIRVAETTIAFRRYSGNRLGRSTGGPHQPVAENIRQISFAYRDGAGNLLPPNAWGTVDPGLVQQVAVTITATTPKFGNYSGSCTLATTITPRNL